ncbi:MAG: LPS assembly lipoprotein LptE [Candidatus Methylacidiphilales bacterium]|nr:LptE family protein [Candidatus Methylacidiphilales bacterium]
MIPHKLRPALSVLLLAALSVSTVLLIAGCAGYRVGNIGGARTQGVRSIYVPMAINKSIVPGIHTTVTSAVVRRLENDGTVETNNQMNADADLQITILNVRRTPSRAVKGDTNITSEYLLTIDAEAQYTNRKTGATVRLVAYGESNFFVQQDQQEGERQSLPLAAENLAYNFVKQITEGW